jgi:hypothetical protein
MVAVGAVMGKRKNVSSVAGAAFCIHDREQVQMC